MSSPPLQVACIAVIGPDSNPILIEKFCDEKKEHEIDTILFCALDFFDQPNQRKSLKSSDRYLGNMQTSDRFQTWGYRCGLGYKIIVLTFHIVNSQDNVMRGLCERVKDVLFSALTNPFYEPFSMIDSPIAVAKIAEIAKSLQTAAA